MDNYEQTEGVNVKSHAIKWGIILGVVSVILALLVYIMDITLMADWKYLVLSLVISIGILIYAGLELRKQNGGTLPFKSAFIYSFLTLIIAGVISTIFSILLFTVIDPGVAEVITDASIDKAEAMMESFGMDDDAIEEALVQAREDTADKFTVGGMMLQFVYSIIGYAIFSLIIGAIIKRNRPEEVL